MTVLRPKRADVDASAQAGLGPLNYDELPGLEDVYLEDSLVREIDDRSGQLRFVLLAALTRAHAYYEPPPGTDVHCFRSATLVFPRPTQVTWSARTTRAFTDARGAVDLGNIDRFVATPEGAYHLEGEWGSVDVVSPPPVLEVLSSPPQERAAKRRAVDAWMTGVAESAPDDHDHDHHHDHGPHRH